MNFDENRVDFSKVKLINLSSPQRESLSAQRMSQRRWKGLSDLDQTWPVVFAERSRRGGGRTGRLGQPLNGLFSACRAFGADSINLIVSHAL